MAKRWRCYIRLHRWVVRWRDEHGEQNRYIVCRDCGEERDLGPIDAPPGVSF
jgi:hypothetical protein